MGYVQFILSFKEGRYIMKRIGFKKVFLVVTLLISFFTLVGVSYATDYYVKNDGNDTAAGTSDGTAWATVAKVNNFANTTRFRSGDTINFKRGSKWSNDETLGYFNSSGGVVEWGMINGLTIQDYGSGALPRFDANTQCPFYIYGGNPSTLLNLTIKNIDISGMDWSTGPQRGASYSPVAKVIRVNGVTIDGLYYDGHIGASNYQKHSGAININTCGGDIEVKNCTIKNGYTATQEDTQVVWGETHDMAGIVIWYADGANGSALPKTTGSVNIHDNDISYFYGDCIHLFGLQMTDWDVDIYDNTLSQFGENAIDHKYCQYVKIYRNDMSQGGFIYDLNGGTSGPATLMLKSAARGILDPAYEIANSHFKIYENYIHDSEYTGINVVASYTDIYNNYFKDTGLAIKITKSYVNVYNNILSLSGLLDPEYLSLSVQRTGIYGGYNQYCVYTAIYNNTIYINSDDYNYGIYFAGVSGQKGNEINRNIIQITRSSSSVYPLYIKDYDGSNTLPRLEYNALFNPNDYNRANIDNTVYISSELQKLKTEYDGSVILSDPMFSDPVNGDFSLLPDSPCIIPNMILGASNLSILEMKMNVPRELTTKPKAPVGLGFN